MPQNKEEDDHKQRLWDHHRRLCTTITDQLDTPLDPGIFETIVAFHALGIQTDGSCEGHLDHGSGAPYVDIEAFAIEALEAQGLHMYYSAEEEADHAHVPHEDVEHRRTAAREMLAIVTRKRLEARARVSEVLEAFYQQRPVKIDQHLVLQGIVLQGLYAGPSRLESQGAALQTIRTSGERQQRLTLYQEEMHAFTVFLKDQFFSPKDV